MALEADAVDRHAAALVVADHLDEEAAPARVVLVVVVVEQTATEAGHQRTLPAAFSSTTFEITAVSTVSGRCEQKPMPT